MGPGGYRDALIEYERGRLSGNDKSLNDIIHSKLGESMYTFIKESE